MRCAICGKEMNNEFGNNPWPVRTNEEDRCCDECNMSFVLPYRIMLLGTSQEVKIEFMKELNTMSPEKLTSTLMKYYYNK